LNDPVWVMVLIWGTWLLIAVVIDGLLLPLKIYYSGKSIRRIECIECAAPLPSVSVVVPAHNEEEGIEQCLKSIITNRYTGELEILMVDDGSTDNTLNKVRGYQPYASSHGKKLRIIEKEHTGKVHTLNTGLRMTTGRIIITIDADVILEEDSIQNMVVPLAGDEDAGAATGYIEVLWDKADPDDFFEMFFAKCEFLEYLSSFDLERNYQSLVDSLYTMSGAFSAFKREAVGKCGGYWPLTVSEDMHITMMLHHLKVPVIHVPDARAYVYAVTKFDTLYSQRVRWARGQLEVASIHDDTFHIAYKEAPLSDIISIAWYEKRFRLVWDYFTHRTRRKIHEYKNNSFTSFGLLALQRIVFVDHTIAFPRLLWIFVLLLLFPIYGFYIYLLPIVALLLYLFYLVVDTVVVLFAYRRQNEQTQEKIEEAFRFVLLLPIYRMMIYSFRMSAFLRTIKEPADWKVQGPVNRIRTRMNDVKNGAGNGVNITKIINLKNKKRIGK